MGMKEVLLVASTNVGQVVEPTLKARLLFTLNNLRGASVPICLLLTESGTVGSVDDSVYCLVKKDYLFS